MINKCRACSSGDLAEIINLGEQFLSDFRVDTSKPDKYPLNVLLCSNCSLAQLSQTVSRENMYHDGYGYRSGVNEQIRSNLKMLVELGLSFVPEPNRWLDIACNDGTLLGFVPKTTYRVGVDPVKKFKTESEKHADFIIDDYFPNNEIVTQDQFQIITSISMFYDLDDPNTFVSTVKGLLAENGVWIVQQNYLMAMLENNSFDNICHEHIEYYSCTAMQKLLVAHELEINKVLMDSINGGSIITVISHKNVRKIDSSVAEVIQREKEFGITEPNSYREFNYSIEKISSELNSKISEFKAEGKRIGIYGASTRGAVIWQRANIGPDLVEYAVERQKEKFGKYFSAVGVKIISEEEMREIPPDYLLVGPWFLKESFISREKEFLRKGGKMIFPLPKVEIIAHTE
jgi:NDP-4-keto-2,6-dideoxyhexose 3-C-methyltransferase